MPEVAPLTDGFNFSLLRKGITAHTRFKTCPESAHYKSCASAGPTGRGGTVQQDGGKRMSTGLYDGCSMGELLVRAIQRGGDRDAFLLDDQRISYLAFGELPS